MSIEGVSIVIAALFAGTVGFYVLREIRILKGKTPEASLLQGQLLELMRQLGDMREQQGQGQIRHLESLHLQLAAMVGTFNEQLRELTLQISQGQGDSARHLHQSLEDATRRLNAQMASAIQGLNDQLARTQNSIGQQLQGAAEVVSGVQIRLGELFETAKHMQELGKDIGRLQDILKAPKLRGVVGEYLLEDLLAQILPKGNYAVQYAFQSGEKVDAVIRLGNSMVPVDAKFPLESFDRLRRSDIPAERRKARSEFTSSVKARVDEIAHKYIRPQEGTYDFALMYIPAENVFYEIIIKDEQTGDDKSIASYALERHVVPVSPNSLYAYLMAIAFGLKGFHIEKEAENIRGKLGELQNLFGRFYSQFKGLGRSIDLLRRKHEGACTHAERIYDQLSRMTGQALELEEDGAKGVNQEEQT